MALRAPDEVVFAACGWSPSPSDDDLLAALQERDLDRAGAGEAASLTGAAGTEAVQEE